MLYVPTASGSKPLPLFVMLHGCTQNPTDFATGTKMNTYGEQYNFFVLYPEQPSSANANKCWNWFEPAHQSRGSGEPALIVSIAQSLYAKYSIDNMRIFVGGLSAGGAMADIMGVTYPDVFRGATVGAGLEYKAATSTTAAFTAMSSGGPDPNTQGQVAYKAMGSYAATVLVLVVHGTADYTVYPVNGKQVVTSFAKTLDLIAGGGTARGYITDTPLTTTPGQVPSGRAYTTYTYGDSRTKSTYIRYITVTSMGHAWSGGSSAGTYTDPNGPDASLIMVNFFLNETSSTSTTSTTFSVASSSTGTTSSLTSSTSTTSSSTTGGNGAVLTSIAAEDGFVGKLASDGTNNSICKIGTATAYGIDDFRTILSFDTSSLKSATSATLTIKRLSLSGSMKPLVVDIKSGTFGATTTLVQTSYYSTPSASNIGTIGIPGSDGASTSFQIPATSLRYLVGNQRTQFMLRQDLVTQPPAATINNLQIYDGQATLSVTY